MENMSPISTNPRSARLTWGVFLAPVGVSLAVMCTATLVVLNRKAEESARPQARSISEPASDDTKPEPLVASHATVVGESHRGFPVDETPSSTSKKTDAPAPGVTSDLQTTLVNRIEESNEEPIDDWEGDDEDVGSPGPPVSEEERKEAAREALTKVQDLPILGLHMRRSLAARDAQSTPEGAPEGHQDAQAAALPQGAHTVGLTQVGGAPSQ